jgi:hypothetical protein
MLGLMSTLSGTAQPRAPAAVKEKHRLFRPLATSVPGAWRTGRGHLRGFPGLLSLAMQAGAPT